MVRVESPFPESAIPRVWSWIQGFRERVADDFAPASIEQFVQFWSSQSQAKTWGVWRDGELGGLVVVKEISPVLAESHCLFKRSFWGHDTTLAALRAVYAEVFATGIEKVFSVAFRDNAQLLGLARRIGAQKEGILRKHTRRGGELVDMIAIGLLREDFERRAVAPVAAVEEAAA